MAAISALNQTIVRLDASCIHEALGVLTSDFNIEILDTVDSTNTYLMRRANTHAPHATCVVAESQTAGRGRQGREWVSVPGGSLMFSLLWRYALPVSRLAGLSLGVGVAMVRALNEMGIQSVMLKWPNDLLHHHRKLAGVLIETGGESNTSSYAVIGIGMNVHLDEAARAEIAQAVTDLASVSLQPIDRNILLAALLKHLSIVLTEFEKNGLRLLRDEWMQYHAYQNKNVRISGLNQAQIQGTVIGIAEDGALLIRTEAGDIRCSVGEISLRLAE